MRTTYLIIIACLFVLLGCSGPAFDASEPSAGMGAGTGGTAGASAGTSGAAGSGTAGASAGTSGAAGSGTSGAAGSGTSGAAGSGTSGAAGSGTAGASAGTSGSGTAGASAGTGGAAGSGGMPPCPTGWTCTDKTALHGSFLWDRETRFGSWYDAKLACMGLATDPDYGDGPWHPALVQEYKTILPLDGNVMPHLPSTQKIDMWTGTGPSPGAPGLGAIIKIWLNMGSYDVEVLETILPYHCVKGVL